MSDKNIVDIELNDDVQERLANYLPISPRAEFQYVPKVFRDSEKTENPIPRNQWPVFTLRGLSGADEAECMSERLSYGSYLCQVVRRGLTGWKNWGNCDFKNEYRIDGKLTNDAISRFPYMLLIELGSVINNSASLSEDEIRGLGL